MSEPAGFATVALLLERLVAEVQGVRKVVGTMAEAPRYTARAANDDTEGLWSVKEVATYLRCSRSKVYQRAEDGTLPCLRVGGHLRFDPALVKAWAHGGEAA